MPSAAADQSVKRLACLPLVPRKPGWPLIGNVEFAGDKGEFLRNLVAPLTRIRLLFQDVVIVSDYSLVEQVIRLEGTHIRGGKSLKSVAAMFGEDSIILKHGNAHKRMRNLLLPCFRPSDLLKTAKQIQHISARRFASMAEQETFEATSTSRGFAFELAMTFIGFNYDKLRERAADVIQDINDVIGAIVCVPVDMGKHSTYGRGVLASKRLRQFALDEIRSRKQRLDDGDSASAMVDTDLLRRMIDARDDDGEPMSDKILADVMFAFTVASYDTTCASLISLVFNMCRFPEAQRKAHSFIREELGAGSNEFLGKTPISDDMWQKLEYVDQIVYECQRVSPPVATAGIRYTHKDFEIGGFRVKEGTTMFFDPISTAQSPHNWDNPGEFNADRFDKSLPGYKRKIAMLNTFGSGRRACLGRGFAQLELKVYATLLLRDYKMEFADSDSAPSLKYPMVMKLDGPLNVKLTRRLKN